MPSRPLPRAGGSWARYPSPDGRDTIPPAGSDSPAMTFSSEVLPAPLRPTRPTLSPACNENEAPVVVNRPPTSTLRSRTWSTRHCRAHGLRAEDQFFLSRTRERRRAIALAVPTATTPSSQSASNPVISPPTAAPHHHRGDLGTHDRDEREPEPADACARVHATQPPRGHRVLATSSATPPQKIAASASSMPRVSSNMCNERSASPTRT